jgi:hypothetical protein
MLGTDKPEQVMRCESEGCGRVRQHGSYSSSCWDGASGHGSFGGTWCLVLNRTFMEPVN